MRIELTREQMLEIGLALKERPAFYELTISEDQIVKECAHLWGVPKGNAIPGGEMCQKCLITSPKLKCDHEYYKSSEIVIYDVGGPIPNPNSCKKCGVLMPPRPKKYRICNENNCGAIVSGDIIELEEVE